MVNQQLVDYIKQQLQGGVQKDAVKKALLDAGWPAADVEDSLGTANAGTSSGPAAASAQTINPVTAMGGTVAQKSATSPTGTAVKSDKFFSDTPGAASKAKSGGKVTTIILAVVIVVLLGALGYVYWSMNNRIVALSGTAPAGGTDTAGLQAQIQQLTNDKTSLASQVSTLDQANQDMLQELGFFAAPTGTSSTVTVKGMVSAAGTTYTITTAHGIAVTVRNSSVASVHTALKALVGQEAIVTGVRRLGTLEITAVTVTSATPPAATSTPPAATSTPAPAPVPAPGPGTATTTP